MGSAIPPNILAQLQALQAMNMAVSIPGFGFQVLPHAGHAMGVSMPMQVGFVPTQPPKHMQPLQQTESSGHDDNSGSSDMEADTNARMNSSADTSAMAAAGRRGAAMRASSVGDAAGTHAALLTRHGAVTKHGASSMQASRSFSSSHPSYRAARRAARRENEENASKPPQFGMNLRRNTGSSGGASSVSVSSFYKAPQRAPLE
mmetsp:Transcript_5268/g.12983  ORF Transcript_5268/g.12983 Transcript_5268/m.12983 type:complete len:203 (-) Transcript_5268:947-1555(-)